MKTLKSLHNLQSEDDIDAAVKDIMASLGGGEEAPEEEPVEKHRPGGKDHEQGLHGDWSDGSTEDPNAESATAQDPSGGSAPPSAEPNSPPDPSPPTEANPSSIGEGGLPDGADSEDLSALGAPDALGDADIMEHPGKPKGESEEFLRETREKYLAQIGPRAELIQSVAGQEQMSVPGERKGIDTMAMYGEWEGTEFDGFTPDREEWQAGILAQMQSEQAAENGMEPKQDKKAVIMTGLPGSGKSFLVEQQLTDVIDTREYLTVNADDIKEKLINDDTPPVIEDLEGGELSSMVHEESSTMRKVWEQSAMQTDTNIIFDITGGNADKTHGLIDKLEASGYDITVVQTEVSVEEAQVSALRRAAQDFEQTGKLGRFVPGGFIGGMASQTNPGSSVIDEHFDEYAERANSAYAFRPFPLNQERPKDQWRETELMYEKKSS